MVQHKRYNLCLWLRQRSVLYVMVTWANEQRLSPLHPAFRSVFALGTVFYQIPAFTSTTICKHSSPHFAQQALSLHFQCVPPAKLHPNRIGQGRSLELRQLAVIGRESVDVTSICRRLFPAIKLAAEAFL